MACRQLQVHMQNCCYSLINHAQTIEISLTPIVEVSNPGTVVLGVRPLSRKCPKIYSYIHLYVSDNRRMSSAGEHYTVGIQTSRSPGVSSADRFVQNQHRLGNKHCFQHVKLRWRMLQCYSCCCRLSSTAATCEQYKACTDVECTIHRE